MYGRGVAVAVPLSPNRVFFFSFFLSSFLLPDFLGWVGLFGASRYVNLGRNPNIPIHIPIYIPTPNTQSSPIQFQSNRGRRRSRRRRRQRRLLLECLFFLWLKFEVRLCEQLSNQTPRIKGGIGEVIGRGRVASNQIQGLVVKFGNLALLTFSRNLVLVSAYFAPIKIKD